jgi:hypothetical protein
LQGVSPALPSIGLLALSCLLLNAGSVREHELGSNRCGLALAASEAGRTARADAARNFSELARPCIGLAAWQVDAFECQTLQAR